METQTLKIMTMREALYQLFTKNFYVSMHEVMTLLNKEFSDVPEDLVKETLKSMLEDKVILRTSRGYLSLKQY